MKFKIGDKVTHVGYPEKNGIVQAIGVSQGLARRIGVNEIYYVTWEPIDKNNKTFPTYTVYAAQLRPDTRVRDARIKKLQEIGI